MLGLDIGGANLKFSHESGCGLIYLPLWKERSRLPLELEKLAGKFGKRAAVVMTGELCDCFPSKSDGVRFIAECVSRSFDAIFMDAYGVFCDIDDVLSDPLSFSASNWVPSSIFVGMRHENCLLVDVGSTTTDVIPIVDGIPRAARRDLERLGRGELVYSGVLRTNVATIVDKVRIDGCLHGISSEYFASTADVYLLMGKISEKEYSCETPDGMGKGREECLRRIARIVCADIDEIGEEKALLIARQIYEAQKEKIKSSIENVSRKWDLDKVVACGIGSFLVKECSDELGMDFESVEETYGREASIVFPAFSVRELAKLGGYVT